MANNPSIIALSKTMAHFPSIRPQNIALLSVGESSLCVAPHSLMAPSVRNFHIPCSAPHGIHTHTRARRSRLLPETHKCIRRDEAERPSTRTQRHLESRLGHQAVDAFPARYGVVSNKCRRPGPTVVCSNLPNLAINLTPTPTPNSHTHHTNPDPDPDPLCLLSVSRG